MKTVLKIFLIILTTAFIAVLLIFSFLNCGIAPAMVGFIIERETGCKTKLSGLQVKFVRPFPSVDVSADSVYLENVQDSINVRLRGVEAKAHFKKDSLFASCSLNKDFMQFGPNRIVLNDIAFSSSIHLKDSVLYGADCSLDIGGGKFISTMFPLKTRINAVSIKKGRDDLRIDSLSVSSGTTGVCVNGGAANLAEYLSGKGDMRVVLAIKSDNVNVNEILSGIYYGKFDDKKYYSPDEEEDESFIVVDKYVGYPFKIKEIIPLIIPDRLNVSADLNVGKARVSILSMSDFSSHLEVMDRTCKVSGCKCNSNLGKISSTLFYSSPSKENLLAGADVELRNLTARKIAAILPGMNGISSLLNSFKGEFSCNATIISQVDTAFVPILRTMKGVINFKGHNMCITNAGDLKKYTSLLMFRNKNIGDIDDVNLYAIVSDSKIKIFPMILGVDRYLLAMTGSHSFENAFDYDISVLKSPVPFKFGVSLHNDGGKSKVKFKFKDATYRDANLPKYYSEVGEAHRRLSKTIGNVLDDGAGMTNDKSSHITRELFNKHSNIKATSLNGENNPALRDSVSRYFAPSLSDSLKRH